MWYRVRGDVVRSEEELESGERLGEKRDEMLSHYGRWLVVTETNDRKCSWSGSVVD